MAFKIATKENARLRLALDGPSGSGKTFTAMLIAQAITGTSAGGRFAVTDSERRSALKYADQFRFLHDDMETHHPEAYMRSIDEAARNGVAVQIIDSLSHAWMGKEGALEQVDKAAARSQSGNSFTAWREVTPLHNRLVDHILQAPHHIIVTLRTKTEYVMQTNDKGKVEPKKIGLAPVQRDGLEYEFDVVGDMDLSHRLIVGKTRCSALAGAVLEKPGADLAKLLMSWLNGPTAEEILTWVQAEAGNCFTMADLSMLNKSLIAKRGAYYNDAAKDILRATHARLTAASPVPTPAASPAPEAAKPADAQTPTPAADLDFREAPTEPGELPLDDIDTKAAAATARETSLLNQPIAH